MHIVPNGWFEKYRYVEVDSRDTVMPVTEV